MDNNLNNDINAEGDRIDEQRAIDELIECDARLIHAHLLSVKDGDDDKYVMGSENNAFGLEDFWSDLDVCMFSLAEFLGNSNGTEKASWLKGEIANKFDDFCGELAAERVKHNIKEVG